MKKEVFLAIAVGFVLGLVITFGIWTANKSLKQLPNLSATPALTPTLAPDISPSPAPATSPSGLTITSPSPESLVTTPKITLTGKAPAQAVVAIVYDQGDQFVTADASGNFSAEIPLEGGYNTIQVTSLDSQGPAATQNLIVTYTTSKI